MKHLFFILGIIFLTACNGNQNGVKFAPKEKVSKLTELERKEAILKKRQDLSGVNLDTLLFSNNIKFTVLSPKPKDEITMNVSELAQMKMVELSCQNGISGLGTNPIFVLAMTMTPINKGITSTIPEKKTGTYAINIYVGNALTKDIYSSLSFQIMGVGDTYEQVAINAVGTINNTSEFQLMLKKASQKIVRWYDSNLETFKMQIESFVSSGNYAQAHALLSSVPQGASMCFQYAKQKQDIVLQKLMEQRKADNLVNMKDAIAESGTSYSPKVGAYYQMIPLNCPEKDIADKLFAKYMSGIENAVNNEIEHKRYLEKAEIEFRTLQVQSEIEASHATILQYQNSASSNQPSMPAMNGGSGTLDSIFSHVINLAMGNISTLWELFV